MNVEKIKYKSYIAIGLSAYSRDHLISFQSMTIRQIQHASSSCQVLLSLQCIGWNIWKKKTKPNYRGVSGGWAIAHSVFVRIEDAAGHRRCAALLVHQILGSQLRPWSRAWPKFFSYLVWGVNSYLKLGKQLPSLLTHLCWKCTAKFWENIFNFSSAQTKTSDRWMTCCSSSFLCIDNQHIWKSCEIGATS